ncbi:MAG: hypothetical protein QM811_13140 [Pirellulales bacterium]
MVGRPRCSSSVAASRGARFTVVGPAQPDQLDQYGCVRVTTDYRSVLAEIAQHRLGNTHVETLFPGFKPLPVGVAKAIS